MRFNIMLFVATTMAGWAVAHAHPANSLLCAIGDIFECTSGEACEKVSHAEIAAPNFIRINLEEKTVGGVGPGAKKDRQSSIRSIDQAGNLLILQGVDNDLAGTQSTMGWTLSFQAESGAMMLSASGNGVSFAVSGACLSDD